MVLPILALTFASVSFVTFASAIFSTQTSTPLGVVFKQAIMLSSGDHLKPESLASFGNPATCVASWSLIFFTLRLVI